MSKKIATAITILVIIGAVGLVLMGGRGSISFEKDSMHRSEHSDDNSPKNEMVLYYGDTCPHCKDVEEYMKKNGIEEKVPLKKKEVFRIKSNAVEMSKIAEGCGLDTRKIGVPFLLSGGKCFIGTPDVISELENQVRLRSESGESN